VRADGMEKGEMSTLILNETKLNLLNLYNRWRIEGDEPVGYRSEVKVALETKSGDTVVVTALVDTGADLNIIKEKFVTQNKKVINRRIFLANGKPLETPHETLTKFKVNGHTYEENFFICNELLYDMILLFEWCRKHKIQFEYLYGKIRIRKTARNMVNTIGVEKEDAENLKETHEEFFKPFFLAKHRGNLDFWITLKIVSIYTQRDQQCWQFNNKNCSERQWKHC
jgi:hypothetical protein